MEITINLDKTGELAALWRQAPSICRDELLRAMTEVDLLVQREVQEATPTAAGTLRSSIHSEETISATGVIGMVRSPLNYAEPVELGTKPHFPPVEALADWVRIKLGISDEREARSVAFLIARKIASKGTEGTHMFKKTMARVEPQLDARFAQARDRILSRMAEG